jgi:hypothetical protein
VVDEIKHKSSTNHMTESNDFQDAIPSSPDREVDEDDEYDSYEQPTKFIKTHASKESVNNITPSQRESDSEDETKEKTRTPRRKRKLPQSSTKSASNGFNLFQLENRDKLLDTTPEKLRKGKGWFNKVASKAWSELDAEVRKQYRERCTAMTGYQLFYSEQAKKMKQSGKAKNGTISGKVADMWNNLSDDQRKEYRERAFETAENRNGKAKRLAERKKKINTALSTVNDDKTKKQQVLLTAIRSLFSQYITTKQYDMIRPFLLTRSDEAEVEVLLRMLQTCLDNDPNDGKKKWEENKGQEYLEGVVKILTII